MVGFIAGYRNGDGPRIGYDRMQVRAVAFYGCHNPQEKQSLTAASEMGPRNNLATGRVEARIEK